MRPNGTSGSDGHTRKVTRRDLLALAIAAPAVAVLRPTKRQPGRALFHRSTGRSESIRRPFGRYLRVSWPQAVRLAALKGIGF